jgi:signal transduction histidine kinase
VNLPIIDTAKPASRMPAAMPVSRFQRFIPNSVWGRTTLIFLPLALASMVVFYLLYATQLSATQRVIAAGQDQLVEVGLTTLTTTLATIDNDAKFISNEPMLQRWLASGSATSKEILLAQYASFVQHRGLYDQLRFIGTDGVEQVRINYNDGAPAIVPTSSLQDKSGRPYVQQTLALGPDHSYFSAFDLNVENGAIEQPVKPTIRIGTPVFDGSGTRRGIVVLNYLGTRALDRVRRLSSQGFGQAWLVDAAGYWLLGPSRLDEWSFMYPDRDSRSFARVYPAAWQQIATSSQNGQFSQDGDLYTYAPVYLPPGAMTGDTKLVDAALAPSWFLVTRTPASTYSQTSWRLAEGYLWALAGVLIVLAAISWIIAHYGIRRRQAEHLVFDLNQRLARDNKTLESVNRELESFSYSVSHDLRAPLRSIDGFSKALLEDYGHVLDDTGQDYLKRVRNAAQRMGDLIDDLIKLARVTRSELGHDKVDMSLLARRVATDLKGHQPDRNGEFIIAPDLVVEGDPRLLQIMLENLLGNAWKFTARKPSALIEFGRMPQGGETVYFVRDNGAGFDMAHAGKLFGVFQRLHALTEFEGTGIGLATVQRIVYKHGGRVWGEAELNRGAAFYFTLRAGARDNETNSAGRG